MVLIPYWKQILKRYFLRNIFIIFASYTEKVYFSSRLILDINLWVFMNFYVGLYTKIGCPFFATYNLLLDINLTLIILSEFLYKLKCILQQISN